MPRNSGPQGNRSFGLDHQNGKGDKSRVTNTKAFRENFENINWGGASRGAKLKTLREIQEDELAWWNGLCI